MHNPPVISTDYLQTFYLALLQGFTEFLPISSSAHLILLPHWLDWADQGLTLDVAVHGGTCLALLIAFRADWRELVGDAFKWLRQPLQMTPPPLVYVGLATLPILPVAWAVEDTLATDWRSPEAIAWATLGFGLLLGLADWRGQRRLSLADFTWRAALIIGLAQVLALFPGVSRSGITMTAALFLGFTREGSARVAFLLAVPLLLLASIWRGAQLVVSEAPVDWALLGFAVAVSGLIAWACIRWMLRWIERIGMWPFVVYRCVLGLLLLASGGAAQW